MGGRDEMTKASINLQDLRRRIYVEAITLDEKPTGQPSAGNPHAELDEAGAGNVAVGAGLRPTTKGVEKPPDPKVRAPALDPTCSGGGGREAPADHNLPRCAAVIVSIARRQDETKNLP